MFQRTPSERDLDVGRSHLGAAQLTTPTHETVAALMPQLKSDLARLVAIPSISALGYPAETRPALLEAHEEVVRLFFDAGVRILDPLELPDTAPVMLAEIPAPAGAPTVLLYSHYDVVPVGDESKCGGQRFPGLTEKEDPRVFVAEREGFEPPGPSERTGCFQGSCNKPDSATAPNLSTSRSVTDRRPARHCLIRYSESSPSRTYNQS